MKGIRVAPVAIGAGSLAVGVLVMAGLMLYKRTPVEASLGGATEPSIRVEVLSATAVEVPVTLRGYGEVRAVRSAPIGPEVSGAVVSVPERIASGAFVEEGEVLFQIDTASYEARLSDGQGQVGQAENALRALELEFEGAKLRAATLKRATELAESAVERARKQVAEGIGSRSELDSYDEALVRAQAEEQVAAKELEVFPYRIAEAENRLASAKEHLRLAELELARCHVRAPYAGRLKAVDVERGQYVMAGQPVMHLADDTALEIVVSLDGRECQQWLRRTGAAGKGSAWYSAIESVVCAIQWTEEPGEAPWKGVLDRIESYDPATRTAHAAVRIDAPEDPDGALPLVEGMFCEVSIPGKSLSGVYPLPVRAVSVGDTVYTVEGDRLRTRQVDVVWRDGDFVYVSAGIEPNEPVIATRLVNPLDNTLCEVVPVTLAELEPGASTP